MAEIHDERDDENYDHHNSFSGDWLAIATRVCRHPKNNLDTIQHSELEMKIFIDCEYNGMGGQLLSMALVPIDKQFEPFYQEQIIYEPITEWVNNNVIPKLNQFAFEQEVFGTPTLRIPYDRIQFQSLLMLYLNQFDKIHLIADWPDDIKYFCDLLITGPGIRMDTPSLTMEIRRDLDCDSPNPHYALSDAIAMRDFYLTKGIE